jgi:hypothetical protein
MELLAHFSQLRSARSSEGAVRKEARMKRWTKALAIAVVGVTLPISGLSQEKGTQSEGSSLRVVRGVVTAGVVNREPIGDGSVFPPSTGAVYYFTEVEGANGPTQITHVWYYQDQKMAEIPLSLEGPRWRTWSSKRILESWVGSWKVEAVDESGNVLSFQTFSVH